MSLRPDEIASRAVGWRPLEYRKSWWFFILFWSRMKVTVAGKQIFGDVMNFFSWKFTKKCKDRENFHTIHTVWCTLQILETVKSNNFTHFLSKSAWRFRNSYATIWWNLRHLQTFASDENCEFLWSGGFQSGRSRRFGGDFEGQGGENAQPRPLIDHWVIWVNFSSPLLWLVSFLQISMYYHNHWSLLLKQFIC